MRSIQEITEAFHKNELSVKPFAAEMKTVHAVLQQYAEYIGTSGVEKIEITENEVVITTKQKHLRYLANFSDIAAYPFPALNGLDYESEDLRIILQIMKEDAIFFDIGANHGWMALNVAVTKPRSFVYAFEPIQRTFGYLNRNIKENELENVGTHNIGFWNEERTLEFYYYQDISGASSVRNILERDQEPVCCNVTTIDRFVCEYKVDRIDFIKCDVEGAELFVLRGGMQSIMKYRPVIFVEMLRKWSAKFNYSPNDIIKMLEEIGYHCYEPMGGKLHIFRTMTEETESTNFFFIHDETLSNDAIQAVLA